MAYTYSILLPPRVSVGSVQPADLKHVLDPLEPTIFHEHWWLNIASEGKYQVAEVESGGKTVGRLAYFTYKRFGIRHIEMPMLTHFLGPGLIDGDGSPNTKFLRRLGMTRELVQKLPPASFVSLKLHYGIGETVAFQEQGFRTSVQFTHEIEPLPADSLWANLRNKTRNVIRRAEEQFEVKEINNVGEFMTFYMSNLANRGVRSFLNRRTCEALLNECIARGRGRILAAYDSNKNLRAANFYLWDNRSYYFLLSTRSLTSGNGATSLLLWEAIKDASKRGLVFDSDGLNSSGAILFFAGIGGTVKPRYIVSKSDVRGRLVGIMRDAVWGKNFFVRG